MSKLSALCGKVKETLVLKADDGTETQIDLVAPRIEDLSNLLPLFKKQGDEVSPEAILEIGKVAKSVLKKSVPDATDEEIDEIVATHLSEIVEAITKLLEKSFNPTGKK